MELATLATVVNVAGETVIDEAVAIVFCKHKENLLSDLDNLNPKRKKLKKTKQNPVGEN